MMIGGNGEELASGKVTPAQFHSTLGGAKKRKISKTTSELNNLLNFHSEEVD